MDLVKRTAQAKVPASIVDFPPLHQGHKKTNKTNAGSFPKSIVPTSIDPNAAAAAGALRRAQLAMTIGQAAIVKHPPTALERSTHGGKFYTVKDDYGNKNPRCLY